MKTRIFALTFFLLFSITSPSFGTHECKGSGSYNTPEKYGVKLLAIEFCENAACSNAIKVGGGQRIDIANLDLWKYGGTLVNLKGSSLTSANSITHVRFQIDTQFVVKASSQGCYTFPTKISAGYSEGTKDKEKYGEQVIMLDTSQWEEGGGFTDIKADSFRYTVPLQGGPYVKGTGQKIIWGINATDSISFCDCSIGPEEPVLDFQVQ